MSKKTLTTIIIIFTLIIVGLFGAAFFLSKNKSVVPGGAGTGGGNLFPTETSGGQGTAGGVGTTTSGTGVSGGVALELPILRQITPVPVAGAAVFSRNNKTYIRYIEKGTGNVYEASAEAPGNNRLTNTTIPRVAHALWNLDGSSVIIRYPDEDTGTIKNFSAKVNELKNALEGIFLRDDFGTITVSPDTDKLFYTMPFGSDTIGATANLDGTKAANIFTSSFSEWLVSWPNQKMIVFATKPSSAAAGYLYFLNTQTKAFDRVLGNVFGLTALVSPDGKRIAYSQSLNNTFTFNLLNIVNRASSRLSVNTLPEKCVWSKNDNVTLYCGVPAPVSAGEYLDAWYRGEVSFSDSIWKINTETGFADALMSVENKELQPVDVSEPKLSPDEKYLMFINKKDQSLWSLKLAS
ncbi:MAG: hypothetical protein HZC03_01515 [Candidatus Lloydbacteria bacterium]|nr:hypothetical protein [Candidatus Lloydbacteria bacterium]